MSDEFDFDRSIDQAWRRFTRRLGEVLSMMDDTEPLTLCSADSRLQPWCVRFSQYTPGHLTALVPVSSSGDQFSDEQAAIFASLGWRKVAEGYCLTDEQDDYAQLAQSAVSVLRQVFLVEHPVFLDSNVLQEILQEPTVAEAGEASVEDSLCYPGLDEVQLSAAVAEEASAAFGAVPVRDHDGDFAVRVGSTMIFIRIPGDGREIRLFSILVHDISGRSRAAEVLNDINAHARWVRFFLNRDKIIVTMSILASPFVPAHLRQAITEMVNIADGVDDLLADSLDGKTTFPDAASV